MVNIIVPILVNLYLRFVRLTSKLIVLNSENLDRARELSENENYIYGLWHEHYPTSLLTEIDNRIIAIASNSKDGELAARVVIALGMDPARGSSSKGGRAALKQMIEKVETTHNNAAITVDGPRGPRHSPKMGIFKLAQSTKVPILPLQAVSSRHYVFEKAWDKTKLPLPFGKIYVCYGEPIVVESSDFEQYAQTLTASQHAMSDQIRKFVDL